MCENLKQVRRKCPEVSSCVCALLNVDKQYNSGPNLSLFSACLAKTSGCDESERCCNTRRGFKDSPYCCKRVNKICKCCKCSSGEEDATRMSSTKANTNGRFRKTLIYESLKCSSGIAKTKLHPSASNNPKGEMIALLCTSSGLIEFDDMPSRDQ
ncbi:hypothetical protein TNCV_989271 [Trichonephila clavipes]|nr:hypothetical protein TNCV_989271 [Trichonephila clavipes]